MRLLFGVGEPLVEESYEFLYIAVVLVVLFGECVAVGIDDDVVGLGVHVEHAFFVIEVAFAEGFQHMALVVGNPFVLWYYFLLLLYFWNISPSSKWL